MNSEALPTFLLEAHELSASIETALLSCEAGSADAGTIDALFRAVHTIKGSAGLFGLDEVVAFAHVVETVLSQVRDARLSMSQQLAAVLIDCHDHLQQLVACAGGEALDADALAERGERLSACLHAIAGEPVAAEPVPAPVPECRAQTLDGVCSGSDCWHISLRYMPETLRNGMDPLASLSFLGTFGQLCAIEVLDDALPASADFDPECCYLGFECRFETQADRVRIESTFEFVREDCILTILPPRAQIADYVKLVQELPESEARLGEILVRCGSLTQSELDAALSKQRQLAQGSVATPLGEILIQQQVVAPAVVEAAVEKQRLAAENRAREQRSVRVDTEKLEALLDLVGELVIEGAQTRHQAQRVNLPQLNESAARLARLVEQVRDQALRLRMMPIGPTFARFVRLVRDASSELGKQIVLEMQGADTELDKTLIEQITDPLTHLVRNAIDHGIEPAAVRAANGKSPQAVVRLNAYHDAGSVVVEVADDGGGLRRDKILAKALERGLVSPGQQLSDQEVHALIFAAGFSTAVAVTNLSGRGVGMDVVKRNVTELRGSIEIESTAGVGTTVRIRLPLTLGIIDGFLVRVGASAFVIPLEMVEECVDDGLANSSQQQGDRYLDLRGEVLPCVRLREHFGLLAVAARRESVVVVRHRGQRAGLIVDELLGEYQTVIKPLGHVFRHLRGLGGATILADGGIALIIDVPTLINQCGSRELARQRAA